MRTWRRLVFRFKRERLDRELAEEIEFHRSLNPREMGPITLAREECWDVWSFMRLERFWQDLRFAVRMFAGTPGFTLIAVLSLALGIGGNAAMFSLVNGLLWRPLPYRQPDRLVRLTGIYPRAAFPFFGQQARTMEIAAAIPETEYNLAGEGEAIRISACAASANLFEVLGTTVARGRGFAPAEYMPGRDGVIILSDALWKTKFGADAAAMGRAVMVNGVNRVIIGVMPRGFSYPSATVQAWVPLRLDPSNFIEYWGGAWMPFVARLKPGATPAQAQGELHGLVEQFRPTFPYPMARDWNRDSTVMPLQQDLMGDIRGKLIILLCSVGLVLLIACANVASLLLARATTRRKEIALRFALGAGKLRIVRQLLTESLLLALIGGGLGILIGTAALAVFRSVLPASTPGLAQVAIDWQVVGGVALLAMTAGLAFGLAPALSASRIDLAGSIRTGSQRSTAAVWARVRSALIAAEVAMTVVLVISAGLLIRSLYVLSEAHPGFKTDGILTVRVSPNQSLCQKRQDCVALYGKLLEGARGIAGVADAAVANTLPLNGDQPTLPVDVQDHPKTPDYPAPVLWHGAVSPSYIHMMGIPLLAGRNLNEADGAQAEPVLLVSAATAKYFWPHESAIGKHIKSASEDHWRRIVGVVGDVRQFSLATSFPNWIPGAIYMPYAQAVREDGTIPAAMTLMVTARGDAARVGREIRTLAQEQNPDVPVGQTESLEEVVTGSIAGFRATIRVFLSFAAAAMLLAGIGIYGLVSYWVTQRTYEIGLRVAIGATRQRIVSMILAQGLRVALFGVAAGVVAALAATRFLASLIYGVGATDVMTFAAVPGLVTAIALAATALPAWRAARIEPAISLRAE